MLVVAVLVLFLLALIRTGDATESSSRIFKVMNMNALNFVDGPNWDKRVYEIREMVLRHDPDCVAFEELRKDKNNSMLVNKYTHAILLAYSIFSLTKDDLVEHLKDKYPSWKYGTATMFNEIDEEGVAIACKWAIHSASSIFMYPQVHCMDPMRRAVVHMSIAVGKSELSDAEAISADLVDLYATHWSYDDCNQDMNAIMTLELANSTSVGRSAFILGDFNAYKEAPNSLKLMEQVPLYLSGDFSSTHYMKDSWRALYPDEEEFPGYTFSPLEEKGGLHNRCDRIFYSGRVTPLSAEVDCENPNSEIKPSDHCAYVFTSIISSTEKEWHYQNSKGRKVSTQNAHVATICVEIVAGVLILAILNRKLDRAWK